MGKIFAVMFICENVFLRIAGKIAKIKTRKNFVPHGNQLSFRNVKKQPKLVNVSEENNLRVALSGISPEAQEL